MTNETAGVGRDYTQKREGKVCEKNKQVKKNSRKKLKQIITSILENFTFVQTAINKGTGHDNVFFLFMC